MQMLLGRILWVCIWSVKIWICMGCRLITCIDNNWLRTTYVHLIYEYLAEIGYRLWWHLYKLVVWSIMIFSLLTGLNIYLIYSNYVWTSNVHDSLTNCMPKPMCKPTFNVYYACSVEYSFSAICLFQLMSCLFAHIPSWLLHVMIWVMWF